MTARIVPVGDFLPAMAPNVDFALVELNGELCIDFRACPCCGRPRRSKKTALMTFDHPALKFPASYLLDERCGRRLNGRSARSSDTAQTVSKSVLGAVLSLTRLAGEADPLAIQMDDMASLALGPERVQ